MALGTTRIIKRVWSLFTFNGTVGTDPEVFERVLYEEFNSMADAFLAAETLLNRLRTYELTRCVTPPNFEISTNFDIQNGDAFEIMSDGVQLTVATDQVFDTGTSTVVTTNAYWAAGILSIDIDGTTTHVDWGAEASTEALALANLAAVTASGDVVVGYVAVQAAAGQDWVAGTDALEGGTGGQVSQDTNYYNNQFVGDAALGAALDISGVAKMSTIESGD
jgi:hypothetical protein